MKGYLDRIVDEKHAVILVEDLKKEYIIGVAKLPDGSKEGTWFDLTIEDDLIIELVINDEKQLEMENKINDIMDKLQNKNKSGSRFK